MVHERIQDIVDHADVVVTGVLLFYVHEIFVEGIQAGGQETGNIEAGLRRGCQKLT